MLIGMEQVGKLPPHCSFWRFLTVLPVTVAQLLFKLQRRLRSGNQPTCRCRGITLEIDTTVDTFYGGRWEHARGTTDKNKGKKSYLPILTFIAESQEYIDGKLHNGDRPTGAQIARHLEVVLAGVQA